MSNLGTKKLKIPSNIKLKINKNLLSIKSKFGCLNYKIEDNFILKITAKKTIDFFPKKENKDINRIWGTQCSLLNSCIKGLSRGYTKTLKLVGVGFRSNLKDNQLILKLGYSHEVKYKIPSDIIIDCPKQNRIVIFGVNKQRVNEIIANIQLLKKINPYKGKGILLENTILKLKEGKKK
jgi:large subunit ribosomal protein L6